MSISNIEDTDLLTLAESTVIDETGENTLIEYFVGGPEQVNYDLTTEVLYLPVGGGEDILLEEKSFQGITDRFGGEALTAFSGSHGAIPEKWSIVSVVNGTLNGEKIPEFFVSHEGGNLVVDDYVFVDSFKSIESANSLDDTVEFEVNVANGLIEDILVEIKVENGTISESQQKMIEVPFEFSSTRQIDVDLSGVEEVCCEVVRIDEYLGRP